MYDKDCRKNRLYAFLMFLLIHNSFAGRGRSAQCRFLYNKRSEIFVEPYSKIHNLGIRRTEQQHRSRITYPAVAGKTAATYKRRFT